MANGLTLKELSVLYAKKQPKMVDDILEETPILEMIPFEEASHGLWNMYEEVIDITGAGFVEIDAPLPPIGMMSDLKKLDLAIMGGLMEVGEDKAKLFGGKEKYFGKKMPKILSQSGVDTEVAFLYNHIRKFCIDNGLYTDSTGTEDTCYSILVVRFESGVTTGIYSPEGFKQGAMLHTFPINGGNLYLDSNGVLVYGLRIKGYFGFQIASPKTVHAIVNIYAGKIPTEAQIDNAIAEVRGRPGNTYMFMHHKCRNLLYGYKEDALQMGTKDKDMDRQIDKWNGIPIICSYNFLDGTEEAVS
jgi:hypothetical protein